MYLEKLKGRKSVALRDMVNDSMIVELKNGEVYGGQLDEYFYDGGGVIALAYFRFLDKDNYKWIDTDEIIKKAGRFIPDMHFWISDIKDILVLQEEYRDKFTLNDMLQIYIDPHFKPLTGVQCPWGYLKENGKTREDHASECDAHLHEALSFLLTEAEMGVSSGSKDRDRRRKLEETFTYIRRRLLTYGAKIP